VPKDLQRARNLFQSAAEKGDADACYNLGLLYERGEGVPADAAKAATWYRLALARSPLSSREATEHAKAFVASKP
jgi:TPR repeat protein